MEVTICVCVHVHMYVYVGFPNLCDISNIMMPLKAIRMTKSKMCLTHQAKKSIQDDSQKVVQHSTAP